MKRTTLTQLIVLPIFIAVLVYSFYLVYVENYQNGTRFECPTRNQSFDLRGDIPISRKDWPILNSSIGPVHPHACSYRQSVFAT
jgi:hypothetical protein